MLIWFVKLASSEPHISQSFPGTSGSCNVIFVIVFSEKANLSSEGESWTPANKAEWEQCLDSGRVIALWHCSLWFMTSLMSLSPLCTHVCVCVDVLSLSLVYMWFCSSSSLSFTSLLWLTLAVTLKGQGYLKLLNATVGSIFLVRTYMWFTFFLWAFLWKLKCKR